MTSNTKSLLLLCCAQMLSLFIAGRLAAAQASEEILVRTDTLQSTPRVGEKIVIQLDVLARNGWAQIRSQQTPELAGGVLKRYESQGTRLNETIAGKPYSGQRYEWLCFALTPGPLTIPAFAITVEVKRWDVTTPPQSQTLSTKALQLKVQPPPATVPLTRLISTDRLQATQQWQPTTSSLKVGDALVRTVSLKAEAVAAMILPPLPCQDIPGAKVYPGQTQIDDQYNRGQLTGKRVEQCTYILEQSGSINVPGQTLSWWQLANNKVVPLELPGRSFKVELAPQDVSAPTTGTAHDRNYRLLISFGILTAGLALALLRFSRPLRDLYHRWQTERTRSEKHFFRQLAKAVQNQHPGAFCRALLCWLDQLDLAEQPAQLAVFFQHYGSSSDKPKDLSAFWAPTPEQLPALYAELSSARQRFFKQQHQQQRQHPLPPLGVLDD